MQNIKNADLVRQMYETCVLLRHLLCEMGERVGTGQGQEMLFPTAHAWVDGDWTEHELRQRQTFFLALLNEKRPQTQ